MDITKDLAAKTAIVTMSVIVAFVVFLGFRDGCSNPSFSSYGNVDDCPKVDK